MHYLSTVGLSWEAEETAFIWELGDRLWAQGEVAERAARRLRLDLEDAEVERVVWLVAVGGPAGRDRVRVLVRIDAAGRVGAALERAGYAHVAQIDADDAARVRDVPELGLL